MNNLFTSLLDDAAVFPPGNPPLADAVPAHDRHRSASYADLVGSFVLAAKDRDALAPLVADHGPGSLALSLTASLPDTRATLTKAESITAVRVTNIEVAIPNGFSADDVVPALAGAGVAFKATAGLHPALRNTDPDTGFEQYDFLNLLAATDAVHGGAAVDELVALLGERDPKRVAAAGRRLDPGVREIFRSFGTCSITEPIEELGALGLLDPTTTSEDLT